MTNEIEVILHTPGPIPGIPGDHGPGTYLVDYQERTIRPMIREDSSATPEQTAEPVPEAPPVPAQPEPPTQLEQIAAEAAQLEQQLQTIEHAG